MLDAIERGRARGLIAAHAVTTVYHVVEKERDRKTATAVVGDLLSILAVARCLYRYLCQRARHRKLAQVRRIIAE